MKKILFCLIVIFAPSLFAADLPCNGTTQDPCIVLDTKNNKPEIKNFRTANELAQKYQGDANGLSQLWMSGSAAPSAAGWQAIHEIIQEFTHDRVKTIIDLDLRQESHGYLNDNSINLTTKNNGINAGKTDQDSLDSEKNWLNSLGQQKSIADVLTNKQFKKREFTKGQTIPVKNVENEETVVTNAGFQYERLMVQDHTRPRNEDVDSFVDFVKHVPSRTWIHIHCRGGDGRTTTFMAMFDMLHNANKVSFEQIIQRQAAVEPHYDLFEIDRKNSQLAENYKKRLIFLEKFYRYSRASLRGYHGTWSQWLTSN